MAPDPTTPPASRIEPVRGRVTVEFNGQVIAATERALRVLEPGHRPAIYLPPDDVRAECLVPNDQMSRCPRKGTARHVDVRVGDRLSESAGWYYPAPVAPFGEIAGHLSFDPERVDIVGEMGDL